MVRRYQQPIPKKNPDNIWDSLLGYGQHCARLGQLPGRLAPLLRSEEIMVNISDPEGVKRRIISLSNDTASYADALRKIGQQHIDKKGSSRNGDDLMKALMIGEQYVDWAIRFSGVVIPTMLDLLQEIGTVAANHGFDTHGILNEISTMKNITTNLSLPTNGDASR